MEDQSSLTQFGGGVETDSDGVTPGGNTVEDGVRKQKIALSEAPENAEPYADDSCPFCLAPADDFEEAPGDLGDVSCGNCDSIIPVDADWYQEGIKVSL